MRKLYIQLLFVLLSTFLFTSCITTHKTNYLQATKNFVPSYKDTFSYEDYRLKIGDKIYIQVYSADEKTNLVFNGSGNAGAQMLSGGSNESMDLYTYSIKPNGNILLPLVGEVSAVNRTLRELKMQLEDSIKPFIELNTVDIRLVGRSFSVIGSGKSGHFNFPKEKVNIYQALAIAGDLGTFTDRTKIKILRQNKNGTQIKTFDVRSVDIINSEFYYLEPDDVIFLQPMKEQFFGLSTFWTALSTVITTYSFGTGIYKLFFTKSSTTTSN